jgi:type II secretory pathway pseudopilin PulG
MKRFSPVSCKGGFTLVELLVVIGIIIVLMGLLLTAIPMVRDHQRKLEAKNSCVQIATAMNAYYADYAKFPPVASPNATPAQGTGLTSDVIVGDPVMNVPQHNSTVFDTLRNIPRGPNENSALNPRHTVYYTYKAAVLAANKPRAGFFDRTTDGGAPPDGEGGSLYDPWGREFGIVLDSTGDERIDLGAVYSDFAGDNPIGGKAPRYRSGAFSMGKDETPGTKADHVFRKGSTFSDDVISWE